MKGVGRPTPPETLAADEDQKRDSLASALPQSARSGRLIQSPPFHAKGRSCNGSGWGGPSYHFRYHSLGDSPATPHAAGLRSSPVQAIPEAHPTGFEPVTFGFVDRGVSSVGLVWARDSALYRDSSPSGFVWTPSRPLPFCCPKSALPHASRRVRDGHRHRSL